MSEVKLTLELAQDLDIKTGRLVGITRDPTYNAIVDNYELDIAQCLLWLDLVHLINYTMEEYDFEDVEISFEQMGDLSKKLIEKHQNRFTFLRELLIQEAMMDNSLELGKMIWEMTEDIGLVWQDLDQELSDIFKTQEEISSLIDELVSVAPGLNT